MAEVNLLPSQKDLVSDICRTIIEAPSFIILNGEAGGGKTTIADALYASGVDSQNTFQRSIYKSTEASVAADVRKYLITELFGSEIFDPNDSLSDTAQMFEISHVKQLIIIDDIDFFDKGFLNELYQFYENYGNTYNMSVVITTGHLLTGLLDPINGVAPKFKEFTIRQISEGEKSILLTNVIKRITNRGQIDQTLVNDLLKNTGYQIVQIVKYAENYVMENFNENSTNKSVNEEENKFSSTVLDNDDVPHVIKHSIKKPTGPNKLLVIGVALVLTVALVGVIVMLLKKQPEAKNPEEVVVSSQTSNDTVVQTARLNDQDPSDSDYAEKQMVDNMMKGIDDGSQITTVDGDDNLGSDLPPLENTQLVEIPNNGTTIVDNPDVKTSKDEIVIEQKVEEKVVENKNQVDTVVSDVKPIVENKKEEVKTIVEEKKPVEKVVVVEKKPVEKVVVDEKKPVEKHTVVEKKTTEKPAIEEKKPVTVEKKEVAENKQVKPSNKPTVEVGVVYPYEGKKGSNNKLTTNNGNVAAKSSGNFVVQVACNSNIGALQSMKNKLGSNAFIYERKNNALKYVLVVGYYTTQQEAKAAASKIGNGAWVKSVAAMRNEKK